MELKVYFSDFFDIEEELLEKYGAFDISLINDLPLFIDPFLLFHSKKLEYQVLHENILKYLRFLKTKAEEDNISEGLLKAWYQFPEIKQNWFGFCKNGNGGSGLGRDFAFALHNSLNKLFADFGNENITKSSHLEKLCIIKDRVGRDNISDFTTNLIHEFLLKYTQSFALEYIDARYVKEVRVANVKFNYKTETWETGVFRLPYYNGDHVLLTPIDILTKDETWINKSDIVKDFALITESIPNYQLRDQINNYFYSIMPSDPHPKDKSLAVSKVVIEYSEFIDYYIKYKEQHGDEAEATSFEKVKDSVIIYVNQFKALVEMLNQDTGFYDNNGRTYDEAMKRIMFMKDVIENNDGYRLFYSKGFPIKKEDDLQIMYRLTWFAASSDVNREVNNGRGPVDFKISRGNKDKTLIEFKLASNSQLKKNLSNQVAIYEKANNTKSSIKVILYFNETEYLKLIKILNDLNLHDSPNIVLIDARNDNKPSASKADVS